MRGYSFRSNDLHSGPTLKQVISLWVLAGMLFLSTTLFFHAHYWRLVEHFGDSSAYIQIANALRTWNFSGVHVKHFWGLPYAMAALSRVTFISCESSLIVISCAASLYAVILAHKLWDGWVAAYSLSLNFDWLQRSFLGGSEPLFVALLFGSLLTIRKERWLYASLLAALATITRPLGGALVIGIWVTLALRREWRRLFLSSCIVAAIGIAYAIPLRLYFNDPLATVHSYGVMQSTKSLPLFGIPFKAIIVGTLAYPATMSNLLLTFGWIGLVTAGVVAMFVSKSFHEYLKKNVPEAIFVTLYTLSVYSYNAPAFARGTFPRFAIPILPYVFMVLLPWIPKDKRLLFLLASLAAILAACSALGIHNIFA
jgi:hypothetical protein